MAHFDIDTSDPGGWKQAILTVAAVIWNQINNDPSSAAVVVLMIIFWCFRLFRQIQKYKEGKELARKELLIKDEELSIKKEEAKQKRLESEEWEVKLQEANEKLQIRLIEKERLESTKQEPKKDEGD